nr:transposon TX1 uncharacterized [Tanacetum cinerariifolium]
MTSVPALPPVSGALSHVRADLIPSPKRVRDIGYLADVEDIPEPAQEGAAEVAYETLGDLVQRFHDHTQAIPVHRIQVIEGVQREQGHRIVRVESVVTTLTERVAELGRDNMRLRGTASFESQRVDRLKHGMSRMHREIRQRLVVDGVWCDDPASREELECFIREDEVWHAIKQRGSKKAPGLDGFNFGFIKFFWGIIKEELLKAVE